MVVGLFFSATGAYLLFVAPFIADALYGIKFLKRSSDEDCSSADGKYVYTDSNFETI